ncbi:efflux RND transporter periplasmic adaptor subunit [Acidobacteriota bacterium]
MKKKAYLIIVLAAFLSFLWAACRSETKQPQKLVKVPVKLEVVEQREIAQELFTFGRLSRKKEIKLSFKTGGIIKHIFVDESQTVKKGQRLAGLDLSEIEAQVRQARSAFQKAERDQERIKNLYGEKAATLEQFQNVQTAFQVAQSRLMVAEFNLRHSEIRAPSKGRILKRLMEENELIAAGQPVFFFASTEKDWVVRAGVSDRDLIRIRLNDPAEMIFDAYPGEKFQASVAEIVESADPRTGTYEIELKVDAGDKRLVSGFVAEVKVFPSMKSKHFIIPVDALVEADGRQGYVFTVENGSKTVRRSPISIGFLFEDKVAVISGLEQIIQVVTDGSAYLSDGAEVEIIHEQTVPESTTEQSSGKKEQQ